MTQHGPEWTDGPGEEKDDEIIRLARGFTELHYRHDLHLDIEALHADIQRRVPTAAPPPQTRFQQVRISISRARRQVPWDWRAPIRRPYFILIIFFLGTIVVIAAFVIAFSTSQVVHYFKYPAPGGFRAQPVAERPRPTTRVTSNHAQVTTLGPGSTAETQSARRPSANTSTSGKLASIGISSGDSSGSLIKLDVALTGQGTGGIGLQANLGVTIDPAAAVCHLQPLGNGNPDISQWLAELKTPIRIKVETGPDHPLVVQISPTRMTSQPLNCSVPGSDAQSDLPAETSGTGPTAGTGGTDHPTADTGGTRSLSGTVGKILKPLISILPVDGPTPSPSPENLDPDSLLRQAGN